LTEGRGCCSADPDADDETFGVFHFAGVGLAGGIGMKEKASAPHARLVCIHLQDSFGLFITSPNLRVTVVLRRVNEIQHTIAQKSEQVASADAQCGLNTLVLCAEDRC
jgi:hypothetical protein